MWMDANVCVERVEHKHTHTRTRPPSQNVYQTLANMSHTVIAKKERKNPLTRFNIHDTRRSPRPRQYQTLPPIMGHKR